MARRFWIGVLLLAAGVATSAELEVSPPVGSTFAVGQRFDVRAALVGAEAAGWRVTLAGRELQPSEPAGAVWLRREVMLDTGGVHRLRVEVLDAAGAVRAATERELRAVAWEGRRRPRVRNVILLIGDGMGLAHRTAARTFLYGLEGGKPGGWLEMERLPVAGVLSTSSLSGLVTDSAAAAHALATGTKTANGMLGVFPDETPDRDDDNARVEQLPSLLARTRGMVSGVVTTDRLCGATPAGFFAHTADRGEGAAIAEHFLDAARAGHLRVLLGGGGDRYSGQGGRLQESFRESGFEIVRTATELAAVGARKPARLLGLFHDRPMNAELDRQRRGDPEVVAGFPDQPSIEAMTRAALAVLAGEGRGFFLLVEGGVIDHMSHHADQERTVWDVLAFDRAVTAAMEFARRTNSDADPTDDTLVIVTADHETGGVVLPGVLDGDRVGTRDAVATYDSGGMPEAADVDGDRFPDHLNPPRKVIVHFGAAPDRYEDWLAQTRPVPPAVGRRGRDRLVHPNPERDGGSGVLLPGVLPMSLDRPGYVPTSTVHTAVDVPLSAYGPGAERLGGVADNTAVFLAILQTLGGI